MWSFLYGTKGAEFYCKAVYPRKNAKNSDSSRPKSIESRAGHMIVKNTKFGGLRVI